MQENDLPKTSHTPNATRHPHTRSQQQKTGTPTKIHADTPLLQALHGTRPPHPPVWFMRQAGRSLPEYRRLREGREMLETCFDPAAASEITLQPVRRHNVDAAIFFSDIVVPLAAVGVPVTIEAGKGPVFKHPVRTADDVRRIRAEYPAQALRDGATSTASGLKPIAEAVRETVKQLDKTPLIGFAGAPFTLAAYLVEGGPSRDHIRARALQKQDPAAWTALLSWAAELSSEFLLEQIRAGASAVQLFDSWAGSLSVKNYRDHVLPASRQTLAPIHEQGTPTIHFAVGSSHLLEALLELETNAVGVDWRVPLSEAHNRASKIRSGGTVLQGNIDPAMLFTDNKTLDSHIQDVLREGLTAPAHIVNLGHGVPPETNPETLTRIVRKIHES